MFFLLFVILFMLFYIIHRSTIWKKSMSPCVPSFAQQVAKRQIDDNVVVLQLLFVLVNHRHHCYHHHHLCWFAHPIILVPSFIGDRCIHVPLDNFNWYFKYSLLCRCYVSFWGHSFSCAIMLSFSCSILGNTRDAG